MNKTEYNQLTEREKCIFSWQVWNKYIDKSSREYDEDLFFQLYGSKRFMVNSKNIGRREENLFELNQISALQLIQSYTNYKELFPIPFVKNLLLNVNRIEVIHDIPNSRFWWLPDTIKSGTKLNVFMPSKATFNVASEWGIKCILPNLDGYYEIPVNYVTANI